MKAAKRYAKALFELAINDLDTVQKDMNLIEETFKASPELEKVLKDPTIGASKKLDIIKGIFGNKISGLSLKLIQLLGKKDRLALLQDISRSFNELYKQNKGIREATVITAVELTDDLKQKIFQKIKELTGSDKIKLTNVVDPSIIGGFILNIDDLRYDASISGKLAKLKSKLLA